MNPQRRQTWSKINKINIIVKDQTVIHLFPSQHTINRLFCSIEACYSREPWWWATKHSRIGSKFITFDFYVKLLS